MRKISIVGAGNVGATAAFIIALKDLVDQVVLLDIKPEYAEGKAEDIEQSKSLLGFDTKVIGTTNYALTDKSDIIVITSGVPRKPGMTREDLVKTNAEVVKSVMKEVCFYDTNAFFIVVSNPVDTMSLVAAKYLRDSCGDIDAWHHVLGLGGELDSARFKWNLNKHMNLSVHDLTAEVVGGHGDKTMIPLVEHVGVGNDAIYDVSAEILKDTMNGGAILTAKLGTSAWYAPASAIYKMCKAFYSHDCTRLIASAYDYTRDLFIGQPVNILDKKVELFDDMRDYLGMFEFDEYRKSAEAIKEVNKLV